MTRSSPSHIVVPDTATEAVSGRSLIQNVVISVRPGQWTKNLFVFAVLIFGEKLRDPEAVLQACLAFAVFCLL